MRRLLAAQQFPNLRRGLQTRSLLLARPVHLSKFQPPQQLQIRTFRSSSMQRGNNKDPEPSFTQNPIRWIKRSPVYFWHFCVHLWTGTKLLGLNIGTAAGILTRVAQGNVLTRRERRLLVSVAGDIFRMVPFSFFIIVPFAEFALPFFLKIFPSLLPSTFTSPQEKEEKFKKLVSARMALASFIMETSEEVKNPSAGFTGKFDKFLREFTSGGPTTTDQVLHFVRQFKDDITLENLKRSQIMQMCRFVGIQPYGPTKLLRWQIENKIDSLIRDDKMIQKEGMASLSLIELKSACAARGMASHEGREKLEKLLKEWIHLSLTLQVPAAILILSRALRMHDQNVRSARQANELIRTEQLRDKEEMASLADTIKHMPPELLEDVETEVEIDQAIVTGDLHEKLQLLKEERAKVQEEREEEEELDQEQKEQAAGDVEDFGLEGEIPEGGETKTKEFELTQDDYETLEELEEHVLQSMMENKEPETAIEKRLQKKLKRMVDSLDKDMDIIEQIERVKKEAKEHREATAAAEQTTPTQTQENIETVTGSGEQKEQNQNENVETGQQQKEGKEKQNQ